MNRKSLLLGVAVKRLNTKPFSSWNAQEADQDFYRCGENLGKF